MSAFSNFLCALKNKTKSRFKFLNIWFFPKQHFLTLTGVPPLDSTLWDTIKSLRFYYRIVLTFIRQSDNRQAKYNNNNLLIYYWKNNIVKFREFFVYNGEFPKFSTNTYFCWDKVFKFQPSLNLNLSRVRSHKKNRPINISHNSFYNFSQL